MQRVEGGPWAGAEGGDMRRFTQTVPFTGRLGISTSEREEAEGWGGLGTWERRRGRVIRHSREMSH